MIKSFLIITKDGTPLFMESEEDLVTDINLNDPKDPNQGVG